MANENKNVNVQETPEAVSKTELFITKNVKVIGICAATVVVIAAIAFLYSKYVYAPKKAEALGQLFPAENLFAAQDYETALKGDGNIMGFEEIAKEYGNKAGKAVNLYAGICELQLGNYESALNYLKKYNGKEAILAGRAIACQGDAYCGLENYTKAIECYKKAAKTSGNLFGAAYLLKAGIVYEELGKNDEALKLYKEIRDDWPMSNEAMDIDKYITRIEAK